MHHTTQTKIFCSNFLTSWLWMSMTPDKITKGLGGYLKNLVGVMMMHAKSTILTSWLWMTMTPNHVNKGMGGNLEDMIHVVSSALSHFYMAALPGKASGNSQQSDLWPALWLQQWPSDKIAQYIRKFLDEAIKCRFWIKNRSISLADSRGTTNRRWGSAIPHRRAG